MKLYEHAVTLMNARIASSSRRMRPSKLLINTRRLVELTIWRGRFGKLRPPHPAEVPPR